MAARHAGDTADGPTLRAILSTLNKLSLVQQPLPGPTELLRDDFGILLAARHKAPLIAEYGARADTRAPLGLLRIDLDEFKSINDTHGHNAGDCVLRTVFAAIVKCCEGHGLAIRAGGDEVVVLLPNSDLNQCRATAERLRSAIQAARCEYKGATLGITASIGLAVSPPVSADGLDERADHRAIQAKRTGKNQVVHEG